MTFLPDPIVEASAGVQRNFDALDDELRRARDGIDGLSGFPAYADLIAADAPVNGWDCQEAAGASSLADMYGSAPLSTLTNVTTGVTTNPLYPGAKSAHCGGSVNDGAFSAAASALTGKSKGLSFEGWFYTPSLVTAGYVMSVSKQTSTYEGWSLGIGKGASGAGKELENWLGIQKPGVAAVGLPNGYTDPGGNAFRLSTRMGTGWNYAALIVDNMDSRNPVTVADGERSNPGNLGDTGWGAYTSSHRVSLFNDPSGTTFADALVHAAHCYVYDYPLTLDKCLARVNLVKMLNT